jgi:hypothetical protein
MVARLILKRSVVDSILTYAQMAYPKESILLLRGHVTPPNTVINDVVYRHVQSMALASRIFAGTCSRSTAPSLERPIHILRALSVPPCRI